MPLGMKVGLGPGDFMLDGYPAPLLKRGHSRQFSAHVYCGQTAGWIKMALGMEMGLGPRHIVQDGDPASLPKRRQRPPILGPFLLWPNGWMHQDATWYGGRRRPSHIVLDGDPAHLPQQNGGTAPKWEHSPQFSAHVYCSQTAVCTRIPLQPRRHCVRWRPSFPSP